MVFVTWAFFPWLGDDYANYLALISRSELALEFNIEPLPLLLILCINLLGLSPEWFFVGHALVLVLFLQKISVLIDNKLPFERYTKILLFFLLCLLLIGPGVSIIRQSVATIIITYAVLWRLLSIDNKSNFHFSGLVLFATAFHYSALPIGILLGTLIAGSASRLSGQFTLINFFSILFFILLSQEIVEIGSNENLYSSHLGRRAAVHEVSMVFYLTTIAYFVSALLLLMISTKPGSIVAKGLVYFCANVLLLGAGLKIVATEYLIFNRVVFYFNPFLLVGVSILFHRVRQKFLLYITGLTVLVVLIFLILMKRGFV